MLLLWGQLLHRATQATRCNDWEASCLGVWHSQNRHSFFRARDFVQAAIRECSELVHILHGSHTACYYN